MNTPVLYKEVNLQHTRAIGLILCFRLPKNTFIMATNTLTIVTGYGSISPKPFRKAYLNSSEEMATQRFLRDYPGVRDASLVVVSFEDELTIRTNGEISAY